MQQRILVKFSCARYCTALMVPGLSAAASGIVNIFNLSVKIITVFYVTAPDCTAAHNARDKKAKRTTIIVFVVVAVDAVVTATNFIALLHRKIKQRTRVNDDTEEDENSVQNNVQQPEKRTYRVLMRSLIDKPIVCQCSKPFAIETDSNIKLNWKTCAKICRIHHHGDDGMRCASNENFGVGKL